MIGDTIAGNDNGDAVSLKHEALLRSDRFVDAIPRNPSGKILKRVLRDQYA